MLHQLSLKQKLLKGGAWVVAGKVIIAVLTLATNAILARMLSPEEIGAYFLTFSLVSVTAILTQFGLAQSIVRLVAGSLGAGQPSRARRAIILSMRIAGLGAVMVSCLLVLGGGAWVAEELFGSARISRIAGLAALWMVILAFKQLIAEAFRGFHDIRLATLFGGLISGVLSTLMFLGLWFSQGHSDLAQVIVVSVIAGSSSLVLSSLILWRKLAALPVSRRTISVREIILLSWPIWITNLAFIVMMQIDLWIMGIFRPSGEVAVYGGAVRLVALITMPLIVVNAIIPPIIAEMYGQNNRKDLEKLLRVAATITGVPSAIILVASIFFGETIMGLAYGSYYKMGSVILVILSLGQLCNVWAGSCGVFMIMTNHQEKAMWITMLSGAIGTLTSLSFVNAYGGVGVAVGVVVGLVLQNIAMVLYVLKIEGIKTYIDFRITFRALQELNNLAITKDSSS